MNIYAIICTRDRNNVSPTTDKLLSFLCSCKIGVYLVSGATSIFEAYHGAFEKINPNDEDIIIFCHDDIEIRENPEEFLKKLINPALLPETGFIGPAGTTYLSKNAVWWDQECWKAGKHRGRVIHLNPENPRKPNKPPKRVSVNQWTTDLDTNQQLFEDVTYYGEPGDVVVLDGLFLAAKPSVVKDIGLEKPPYFEGGWDFYDIHYTSQAFLKGYTNKVIDLNILHNSRGELVGKDSWYKNQKAFIENTDLPLEIKD
jgi:hypothetical protein